MQWFNRRNSPEVNYTIDFVAPYPLSECVYRLGEMQELRDIPFVPRVKIQLKPVKNEHYRFTITEVAPASIEIRGDLYRLGNDKTHVTADATIQRRTYVEWIPVAVLITALFPVIGLASLIFGASLGVFVRKYWIGSEREYKRLIRQTEDTLGI